MNLDDKLLVELARQGSVDAIAEIYERYWHGVWTAAYAITGARPLADDAAQEAMQRAFRALDDFDTARPLGPWLKRIAANTAIDQLRRERRHRHQPLWSLELEATPADEVPFAADVVKAVEALPERRRLVIVLHYWLDYGLEEIAQLLDLPFGTVASRLSRARAELRTMLEECNVA
jgi:RNA polymerase sigma-70 factor (ECF subfamily)